jgi:hypothetical protein
MGFNNILLHKRIQSHLPIKYFWFLSIDFRFYKYPASDWSSLGHENCIFWILNFILSFFHSFKDLN